MTQHINYQRATGSTLLRKMATRPEGDWDENLGSHQLERKLSWHFFITKQRGSVHKAQQSTVKQRCEPAGCLKDLFVFLLKTVTDNN